MNKTRFHDNGTQAVLLRQKRRMLMIKTISILLPFLILGAIEGALRLFNYGHDLRLFITAPGKENYYVLNPSASLKYFSNEHIATTGNRELFKKTKDTNTVRIFVLGESTTIGYPYFHNGSFHRWLQYRLWHNYPDKQFEIINLSLTGVNSYTVAGFAKEIIPYQPDAVLIYTGHNEYYGCLGAGSTDKITGSPFMINLVLKLREFRLTQLISNTLQKFSSVNKASLAEEGKTRMELMVANQQITMGSEVYKRGIQQFTDNMSKTLDVLDKAHVPVFVSNLVSSENDLFPFISAPVDSVKYPDFLKLYRQGEEQIINGDSVEAQKSFTAANNIYGEHAGCNYYLGVLNLHTRDSVAGKAYFDNARDYDVLRFRAPSKLNEVLSQICTRYKYAHLVDVRSVFEVNSLAHIVGSSLVLEHVHPNLRGYSLMSDAFYQALKQEGILPEKETAEMDYNQLRAKMPVLAIDSLAGAYKIANLKKSWPFNKGNTSNDTTIISTPEEQMAYEIAFRHTSWAAAMKELYTTYNRSQDWGGAAKVLSALALEHPTEAAYFEEAANFYGKANNLPESLCFFKRAFLLEPDFAKARMIFVLALQQDQPKDALPYLDYAIANNEPRMDLQPVRAQVLEVLSLQTAAEKDPNNLHLLNQIAAAYLKMGNTMGAVRYVEKVLELEPKNTEALALNNQIKRT